MTRRKLIYLVTEDWYFVSHRLALAKAALEAGYDVSVVTRVDRHGDQIREAGLNLTPLAFNRAGMNPVHEARTIAAIAQIYRDEKPDIVHHVAMKPVLYGSLAARIAGVSRVVNAVMGLGYVFASNSLKARLLRPGIAATLKPFLSGDTTRVIVQNHDDANQLMVGRITRQNNLRLILGSGVDLDEFSFTPLPSGRPRIVLPARMIRHKGIANFVEASRILKQSGVDAEFVLAGSPDHGNIDSHTESEIQSWVTAGLVTYLGWRTDMADVLKSATLVCLPTTYREGLPKSLLEAAAIGRPIIATDVPGCREIVRPGINGWLLPPSDSAALAETVRNAIASQSLCQTYGHNGRKLAEAEFSLPKVIADTLAIYREIDGV